MSEAISNCMCQCHAGQVFCCSLCTVQVRHPKSSELTADDIKFSEEPIELAKALKDVTNTPMALYKFLMDDRYDIVKLKTHVERLEKWQSAAIEKNIQDIQRIRSLEKTIAELVDKIAGIANFYYREKRQPYKCPVCDGEGGAMINGVVDELCRSCAGSGVLWK